MIHCQTILCEYVDWINMFDSNLFCPLDFIDNYPPIYTNDNFSDLQLLFEEIFYFLAGSCDSWSSVMSGISQVSSLEMSGNRSISLI